jgi:hypothetical protein
MHPPAQTPKRPHVRIRRRAQLQPDLGVSLLRTEDIYSL